MFASATNAAAIWQEKHTGPESRGAKEMFAAAATGDTDAIATINQVYSVYACVVCYNILGG